MKYMGSKSRIAKYIVPIIQSYITDETQSYIEPFVGGANVIDKITANKKIGYDINKFLIALLIHVKENGNLPEAISFDEYKRVRESLKTKQVDDDWYVGCVGFLASYNGRWFDGGYAKAGYEKTKGGLRYRDYYQEAKANLLKQRDFLLDVEFLTIDYKSLKPTGSVIYCDPPYKGTKNYGINPSFDTDEFWETVRKWSEHNTVIVSEENAPPDFDCIWDKSVSRTIKATEKSKSTEKLFVIRKRSDEE